jgi:hypothetical protein
MPPRMACGKGWSAASLLRERWVSWLLWVSCLLSGMVGHTTGGAGLVFTACSTIPAHGRAAILGPVRDLTL